MGEHTKEGLELLKAIRQIMRLMSDIEDEILSIYTKLTSTTVKPKEVDVQTSLPSDPMGEKVAQILEYEEQLNNYKAELYQKKCKVLITLKELEVEDQRLIILRYFKGLSIEDVAEEVGISYKWAWEKLHEAEDNFCYHFKGVEV